MTKRRTVEDRAKVVVDRYLERRKPKHLGPAQALDYLLKDIKDALEAHARAEVKHVTKDWDHGL